jgi:hypothetical protein
MNCEYCDKSFLNKSTLRHHQKTAKYCLEKQGINNQVYKCQFCSTYLTTRNRLKTHVQICKEKQKKDIDEKESIVKTKYKKELKELEKKLEKTEDKFEAQKKEYEEKLEQQKKEYEEKLERQKKEYDDNINRLELKLEKLENAVIDNSKKPSGTTQTNTTNNIIVTNNNTLNLTDKDMINEIVNEKLTQNYICNGQRGLAKFAYDNILTDENGNLKYKCVDPSRQNFEFTNNNGIAEKDM